MRMRKRGEPVYPLCRPSAPLPMGHMGLQDGGCLPCARTAGLGRWDRDLPRAGIAGWWGCALRHGGDTPAVGSWGCCDPRPAVGPAELLHVPLPQLSTPLHFAFRGPLPCSRAGVYLIILFIRCLSVKTSSTAPCKAHLSPPYLSIQLTSPLSLLPPKVMANNLLPPSLQTHSAF